MTRPDRPLPQGKYTPRQWWAITEKLQRQRGQIELFRPFVKPGDLVFDVGANRGQMTLLFRWLGARVIAVEPLIAADVFKVKELAWKFGEDKGVITVARAVSNRAHKATLHVHKNLAYLSSINLGWMRNSAHSRYYKKKNTQQVQVEATTLDLLIKEYGEPAFIKIDVEGHENAVLKGLTQPVAALNVEFHEDWLPVEGLKLLEQLGDYRFNYALNRQGKFALDEWLELNWLLKHLRETLEKKGPKSWGDIYARRGND